MSKKNYNLHIRNRQFKYLPFHPYFIVLILVMAAMAFLFIGALAAYIYTAVTKGLVPPKPPFVFALSTFVLIISTLCMNKAVEAYEIDHTEGFRFYLWSTLICTLFFLGLQCVGWYSLYQDQISLQSGNGAGYLFFMSGLHFLHVLFGLPFLGWLLFLSYKRVIDSVTALVYYSDPEQKLRLRLVKLYWYFLDILWLILIAILTANYLVYNYLNLLN